MDISEQQWIFYFSKYTKDMDKIDGETRDIIVSKVKQYLDQCAAAVSKDNRKNIVKNIFDYLQEEKSIVFIYSHYLFSFVMFKKLNELSISEKEDTAILKYFENCCRVIFGDFLLFILESTFSKAKAPLPNNVLSTILDFALSFPILIKPQKRESMNSIDFDDKISNSDWDTDSSESSESSDSDTDDTDDKKYTNNFSNIDNSNSHTKINYYIIEDVDEFSDCEYCS